MFERWEMRAHSSLQAPRTPWWRMQSGREESIGCSYLRAPGGPILVPFFSMGLQFPEGFNKPVLG